MNYEEYVRLANEASECMQRGEPRKAAEILETLVSSDISLQDKAVMCVNLAIVYDKLGDEKEALRWYDRGVSFEGMLGKYWVEEKKAAYLAERGYVHESVSAYRTLLARPELSEEDRNRIQNNIRILEQRLRGRLVHEKR